MKRSPNDRGGAGRAAIDWDGIATIGAVQGVGAAQLGAVVSPPLVPAAGVELPEPAPTSTPIPWLRIGLFAALGYGVSRVADLPTAPALAVGALVGFLAP